MSLDVAALVSFLGRTPSQKDVSLVIAEDTTQLSSIEKHIIHEGFSKAHSLSELFLLLSNENKILVHLSDTVDIKPLYDFLVQYPTGQVEILNSETMESTILHPKYTDKAIIFLTEKDQLLKIESQGFLVRSYAGLTYQQ
jgi:hypothetical protein